MKIAALTMVHRDHWALGQWYRHHAAALGAANLFVVAHGADPEIARICPGASIITVPRDDLTGFDRRRGQMLDGFQAGLHRVYDWVIRTDADELICWDPTLHDGLAGLFAAHDDVPVLTALGFDLVAQDADGEGPLFAATRHVAFSGHYSKAVAARRPVSFQLHGTKVAPRKLADFPFRMPRGFYLAHLKYADRAALAEATRVRMAVAGGPEGGLPGEGWRLADADAAKFFAQFAAKRPEPWARAEQHAWETLSVKPARLEKHGVVKARALKFDHRTILPDWFASL
ncbi:glycosyltransferase family 2 protein [Pseudoponticoccus marisrubri]|uniref:Glycosyl transferase family 2 n=1 Tax=Pseudoponticoccus marisrubri TaxID=1685382 RepID=A0A0W7WDR9_9RHOB|nr:glycosyltransferase family 2 protein [Pseudoponticoccus marisrubri]KUF08787.1 glycosyl transferase family 2 [Pseudoponticoccus marisrubri]